MNELLTLNPVEIRGQKKNLSLLVLDESSITCQRLVELKNLIDNFGGSVVLMILEEQYQKGLRGWAKAQILGSVTQLTGILPTPHRELSTEISSGWRSVFIPDPVVLQERHEVVLGESRPSRFEFIPTDDPEDLKWMEMIKKITPSSNCWYYPAGCVYVRNGEKLIEAVSTNYNRGICKSIPLDYRQLPLNPGERLSFCDSQHAEKEGIAQAARQGTLLEGATVYISKFPCRPCIESMLGAGIKRLVFGEDSYGLPNAQLLIENRIQINRVIL